MPSCLSSLQLEQIDVLHFEECMQSFRMPWVPCQAVRVRGCCLWSGRKVRGMGAPQLVPAAGLYNVSHDPLKLLLLPDNLSADTQAD